MPWNWQIWSAETVKQGANHRSNGPQLLPFHIPRTAYLFERLRSDSPEITDPRSGSLPFLRHALLWMLGMRWARPWNPSSQCGLLPRCIPLFQTPPLPSCFDDRNIRALSRCGSEVRGADYQP